MHYLNSIRCCRSTQLDYFRVVRSLANQAGNELGLCCIGLLCNSQAPEDFGIDRAS
jgi:hypothetical protein